MSKKFSIEIIEAPMTNNKQQTAVELYTEEQTKDIQNETRRTK